MEPRDIAQMKTDLGALLSKLRDVKGLTQQQLADHIEVNSSRSTIGNTETGRQFPDAQFWEECDRVLDASGELMKFYRKVRAAIEYRKQQDTESAQRQLEEQQAAWTPSRLQPAGPTAGLGPTLGTPPPELHTGPLSMGPRAHAMALALRDVAPTLVEGLEAEAIRHAYGYASTPPLIYLNSLETTRALAAAALEQSRRPATAARLFGVAARTCGLAATTAFDLGRSEVADEYAQAAYVYADFADESNIREWIRSVQATLLFWDNNPRASLELAFDGLRTASGPTESRLHAIASRAWAAMGESEKAVRELDLAHQAIDEVGEPLPGELTFSRARLALCSAAVHVALGDGRAATEQATEALEHYERSPRPERRFAVAYSARMELAAARIVDDEADGIAEVLAPALAAPPALRTARLSRRLNVIRRRLSEPQFRRARSIQEVRVKIEDFRSHSLPAQSKAIESR